MSPKIFWDDIIFIFRPTFPLSLCFDFLLTVAKLPSHLPVTRPQEERRNGFNAFFPSKFIPDLVHSLTMTNAITQQLSQPMTHKRTQSDLLPSRVRWPFRTLSVLTRLKPRSHFFDFLFMIWLGSASDWLLPIILPIVWKIAAWEWTQLEIL